MEAMASGCYCLAHRWDGADELLPEGYLFHTNEELKMMIEKYCEMPEADQLAQKKYMRALAQKNFDLNHTIEKIKGVISEVAAKNISKAE
jgi:glycosyltransferase involved in cell wall biosynthesis